MRVLQDVFVPAKWALLMALNMTFFEPLSFPMTPSYWYITSILIYPWKSSLKKSWQKIPSDSGKFFEFGRSFFTPIKRWNPAASVNTGVSPPAAIYVSGWMDWRVDGHRDQMYFFSKRLFCVATVRRPPRTFSFIWANKMIFWKENVAKHSMMVLIKCTIWMPMKYTSDPNSWTK